MCLHLGQNNWAKLANRHNRYDCLGAHDCVDAFGLAAWPHETMLYPARAENRKIAAKVWPPTQSDCFPLYMLGKVSAPENQGGFAVPKLLKRAVLLGLVLAVPQLTSAQDREFPTLNSIGRYLGVGYTRSGFQAANDGRFDIVSGRHPATDYRAGGLPQRAFQNQHGAPAVLGWQPQQTMQFAPTPTTTTTSPNSATSNAPLTDKEPPKGSPGLGKSPAQETSPSNDPSSRNPRGPEVLETPKPISPPKPDGPPPTWLQDYLREEQGKNTLPSKSSQGNIDFQELDADSSPSDLLLDDSRESLLPAKGVTYTIIEAGQVREPSIAPPQPTFQPPTYQPTNSNTINRYRSPFRY